MGCVVLRAECCPPFSLVLQCVPKLCLYLDLPITLASDGAHSFALYVFFSFFPFSGGIMCWCCVFMNVLTIFMVEEFYIYAVVQFYFFLQEKV